jgi:hypothetical protein
MRVFWAILGVVMLAAAAYLLAGPTGEQKPEMPPPPPAPAPSQVTVETPKPPTATPQPDTSKPVAPPVAVEKPAAPAVAEPAKAAPVEPAPKPEPPKPEPEKMPPPKPPEPAPEPAAPATPAPAEKPAEKPAEAAVVTNPDGTITVAGKYTLKGDGTPESPYQISWDQLVAAQEDYVPRDGKNQIPAYVKMLDGKYVQITGNIAFPLMMDEADECLVMLNQWDGCCIGVPPTPYDAIEVKLRETAKDNARLATYGTLKGRLHVDPHLVGGWLVGLYLMDEAKLTPQAYGGFAP